MERLPGWLPVHQAAAQLDVSPEQVYELIAGGRLAASRVGRHVLVRSDSVQHRAHVVRPQAGRPWSPRIAWAVLWVASDLQPDWVSSAELVRVRRYARRPSEQWPRLLTGRAVAREVMMLSSVLKKLMDRPGICVGGIEAAITHGAPLVAGDDHSQALYVSRAVSDELSNARGVRWGGDIPNVLLRILPNLPEPVIEQITRGKIVPRAVAAADLLDMGDERSVSAANDLLHSRR